MEITIRDFEKMIGPAKQYADHVRNIEVLCNNASTAQDIATLQKYKEAIVGLFVKERFKFQQTQPLQAQQAQAGNDEL